LSWFSLSKTRKSGQPVFFDLVVRFSLVWGIFCFDVLIIASRFQFVNRFSAKRKNPFSFWKILFYRNKI